MSDPGDSLRPKDPPMWLVWTLIVALFTVPVIVGVVKFIAWWKIAFVL